MAVLPFSNLSGDRSRDISPTAWLTTSSPVCRASSGCLSSPKFDVHLQEPGRQEGRLRRTSCGVRYVLEGSVRKVADRVRINGQLIDAATGMHVWAERYDRKSDDIFALQDEIALSVVGAIEPSLRRAEFERVKRKRPDSLDAYDLVLQAQPDVFSGMPDRSEKALVLLDRAILLDPAYALAHGLAAVCYHNRFCAPGCTRRTGRDRSPCPGGYRARPGRRARSTLLDFA